ncbi:MAG: hypothetical protein H6841_11160 [Planctomycetes bacterium]|nr:hypothetical protein [Planctomycetota bacterium]MCB9936384.1 hypothetical protein [Planctomycetota bacterium]
MQQAPYSSYWKGRPAPLPCTRTLHRPTTPLTNQPSAYRSKGLGALLKVSLVSMFFIILGLAAIPLISS